MQSNEPPLLFAEANARSSRQAIGIRQVDRLAHMYLIGKTGAGKTTLIETMMRQDIAAGRGCALIDPHGDLVRRISAFAMAKRHDDVIEVDITQRDSSVTYNPLLHVGEEWKSPVTLPPTSIQRDVDSGGWFGR